MLLYVILLLEKIKKLYPAVSEKLEYCKENYTIKKK